MHCTTNSWCLNQKQTIVSLSQSLLVYSFLKFACDLIVLSAVRACNRTR
uniref:Uncharacterized protein n=1 Tax=Setaria italica TaxID=4555 RepID=K3YFR8_SETIT